MDTPDVPFGRRLNHNEHRQLHRRHRSRVALLRVGRNRLIPWHPCKRGSADTALASDDEALRHATVAPGKKAIVWRVAPDR